MIAHALIKQLHAAKTFGDILAVDLPQPVHPLQRVDLFNGFSRSRQPNSDALMRVTEHGVQSWKQNIPPLNTAFAESRDAILAVELPANRHTDGTLFRDLTLTISGWRYGAIGGNSHQIHADLAHTPTGRVYFASVDEATKAVQHQQALEIIRRFPFAQALSMKIDDPEGGRALHKIFSFHTPILPNVLLPHETVADREALTLALVKALTPTRERCVNLMSAVTLHASQTQNKNGRIFLRGYAMNLAQ